MPGPQVFNPFRKKVKVKFKAKIKTPIHAWASGIPLFQSLLNKSLRLRQSLVELMLSLQVFKIKRPSYAKTQAIIARYIKRKN